MRWYLYSLTNKIDGKIYVGLISRPRQRLRQHLTGRGSQLVWKAVQAHGEDAFDFEVLVCTDYEHGCHLEQECIKHFGTLAPNGYNLDTGGSIGHQIVTESREKISAAAKVRLADPEARQLISDRQKAHYANPDARKLHSEIHKALRRRRPELLACLSEANRAYFADPANRRKHGDAMKGKTACKGASNGQAKLTDDDVRLVRTSHLTGRQLAADLGVSPATISNIRRNKIWTHVL